MKQTFKNFKFYLAESDRPRYHKVDVTFTVDGERYQESLYIKNVANKKDQYYIDEAKKQVEKHTGQNLNPTKVRAKKSKKAVTASEEQPTAPVASAPAHKSKHYGDRRPIYVCSAIMGLVAVTFAGLFVWKLLSDSNTGGGGGGEKYTSITLSKEAHQNIQLKGEEKILIGEDYEAEIVTIPNQNEKFISNEGDGFIVTCQKETLKKGEDYTIERTSYADDTEQIYVFEIYGEKITGEIVIEKATLTDKIPDPIKIALKGDIEFTSITPQIADIGKQYIGTFTCTKGTIKDVTEVTRNKEKINFTPISKAGEGITGITIESSEIRGDESVILITIVVA